MLATLAECGFEAHAPRGAYYVMANFRALSQLDDTAFAMELVQGGGVATVPGSSFFRERADGRDWVRFCFAKKLETLAAARAVLVARLGAAHR
jgi:aminotransferase